MKPVKAGLPEEPSVAPEDELSEVVRFMVKKNLKEVSVIKGEKVIGMIRLDELFEEMGLHR